MTIAMAKEWYFEVGALRRKAGMFTQSITHCSSRGKAAWGAETGDTLTFWHVLLDSGHVVLNPGCARIALALLGFLTTMSA